MKKLYKPLFEINEYAHELKEEEIKGLIVQVTGNDLAASVTKHTYATFSLLNELADFEDDQSSERDVTSSVTGSDRAMSGQELARVFQ